MFQDMLVAALAGLAGTTVMTVMMLGGKQIGLPAIDVHGLLGYIMQPDRRGTVGYVLHWVLGAIFAIPYIILFRAIPDNVLLLGALLGAIHWLLVGGGFAFAPLMHAGMKAGTVKEPGAYMLKSLGIIGFIGGLVGHIVFGITVAL
jgi:uncharacterized membrane protein YagU involved in acid resistance